MTNQRPTVFSVFTGAGGLDCGLEVAGMDTIACVEIDNTCRQTLEQNRPGWKLLDRQDVMQVATNLQPEDLGIRRGDLDVLAGGPPCQPFSVAGQWTNTGRLGMSDKRAGTVVAMLDLAETLLPRVVLIENVAGFLQGKVSAGPYIESRLDEINARWGTSYKLKAAIVDAADYGVPQHRKRVIAVAIRDGVPFTHPLPTHDSKPITAWDAIGDLGDTDAPAPAGGWTDLLPSIPEGHNYQYLSSRGDGEELFGYRTRYWSFLLKLARDRPSWTLPASPGPATGPFHWNNRPLSVRERLRLQSFPDNWMVTGNRIQQVKQAGNATPPLLAEVVGRALIDQVLRPGSSQQGPPRLIRKRATAIPSPVAPTPVPQRFHHLVGPKKAHEGAGRGPSPRVG
ncbi:DNA cytosine methyltransferase [Actinoplanes sp. NPDC048791]|uniref:DNA cytosine methyltransferase n=1 Tax=Actinoplanes sp. NPDC048791 TaxID=3154623 RepID=UPI0033CD907D